MLGRILLDNDYFLVTAGLLGAIKVTLKSRGLTLKATREERTKLLDVLDELKRRGYSVEPGSREFERILSDFSKALCGKGDARWKAYFLVMTCEDIVSDIAGEEKASKEVENEEQGVYTRWALKRAIKGYAAEVENKLDNGKINWDYVAADASIVYGDEIDTNVIYEVLEEVALDIEPDRVNYIKLLKKH